MSIIGAAGGNTISAGTFTAYAANGGPVSTDRVFDIGQDGIFGGGFGGGTGVTVSFFNLTIQNGNVREALVGSNPPGFSGANYAFGGGIRYDGFGNGFGSLTLTNTTVTSNQSDNAGGGVYQIYGTFNASGTTFSNNITKAGEGGGLFFGAATSNSNVNISNSTFTANEARQGTVFGTFTANADGGGTRINAGDNTVTINNTNFTDNVAQEDGGAIKVNGGLVTVTGGTMTGNKARRHGGVAFGDRSVETDPAFLTFSGSTMRNNTANSDNTGTGLEAGAGGAVFQDRGVLTLTNCIIGGTGANEPNTATDGGGVAHFFTVDSAAGNNANQTIVNINGGSIIGNNATANGTSVGNNGGGVYFNSALFDTNTSILNIGQTTATTISSNRAENSGGGIHISNQARANLNNMTLRSNQANSDSTGGGDGGAFYQNIGTTIFTGTLSIGGSGFANSAVNGGGISNTAGTLTIPANASITFNQATGNGGGINNGGTINSFSSASINNNSAANGGGIANSGTLTMVNGTVSNNTATTNGGGIFNSGGTLALNGVTVDGNSGGAGDGLTQTAGTFNGSNTLNFNSGNSINLTGGTFNSTSGTLNLTGNFTNSGGSFVHNSGTVVFNGTGAQSLGGSTSSTFNNLTVNKTGTLTLGVNTPIVGNLTLTNGTFDLQNFTANRTAAGGTLTLSNASILKIGGTNTLPSNYNTHSFSAASTIEYSGSNQNVAVPNSSQRYSNLVTSGSGTKTLAGAIGISGNLTIGNGTTLDVSASNFAISFTGANWTNNGTFNPRSGTVTFDPTTGTQLLGGNTTFYNLTLANTGATTNLGSGNNTIQNTLSKTAGSMDGGTGTTTFTGATGSITGAGAKEFNNLTINSGATISNSSGGNLSVKNDYTNNGTFTQAAGISTTFITGTDGSHSFAGSGTTTFGNFTINSSNTVDAGSHNFNVVGASFNVPGTFTGNTSTVTFNGAAAQSITGDGTKNFNGLTINNATSVTVNNATPTVDATVGGTLTLTTDLTVASGAILQQSGLSAGVRDVIGTVRRTDLAGGAARAFGNLNNTIAINSGTAPTSIDVTLAKVAPPDFPSGIPVVPRTYTLTPIGGSDISATVKLRYLDPPELTGITESRLILWKKIGATWTAQGGAVDAANNAVSLGGVTSFSDWAIAEGSDLTLNKVNNVSNSAVVGQPWTWTLTINNIGGAPATFNSAETILTDNLPDSNINYGVVSVSNQTNITGGANLSCGITNNDLTCTANGGAVSINGAGSFQVSFTATPLTVGAFANPRSGGGVAQADPNGNIVESNEGNNSASNSVTVNKANTTTAVTSSQNPSVLGQQVTFTANVAVTAPGAGTPTGTVEFRDGGTPIAGCATQPLNGSLQATCQTSALPVGNHTISAVYSGDANFNTSTGNLTSNPQVVNKVNTSTTVISSDDTADQGQSITFTATVVSNPAGHPTAVTGTVEFLNGATPIICDEGGANGVRPLSGDQATCTTSSLPAGANQTITAQYSGDGNFETSSGTVQQTVVACESNPVVTSTDDSGAGTLRDALAGVCASPNNTITFDIAGAGPHTITLSSTLVIARDVQIVGPTGESVTITANGGNFRAFRVDSPVTAAGISNLTVTGANVTGASGGGLLVQSGTVTLSGMLFTGNTVVNEAGGAVGVSGGATLNLRNSTISGNTATFAGGIYNSGATLNLLNSTVTNNTADGNVGGGPIGGAGAVGGGIETGGGTATNIKNSIVAGNFATSDANISGTITDQDNNILTGDPRLAALAHNGGPTQTHALLIDSPALDAGDNTASDALPLTTDQRGAGFPRKRDAADSNTTQTVDIGAYEADPTVEDIQDQTATEDQVDFTVPFFVGDDNTAFDSITALTSNGTLVTNINITGTTGTGQRTLNFTLGAHEAGTSTITVTATKTVSGVALSMQDTFLLTVTEVNDAPIIATNAGLTVAEGSTGNLIGSSVLSVTDVDHSAAQLTYTVSALPAFGTLQQNGTPLTSGGTFTQSDVDNNLITYDHDGSETTADSFTFSVSDGSAATGSATFNITVTAVNDAPTLATNAPLALIPGTSGTIANTLLQVADPDNTAAQLTFTVDTAPAHGTLSNDGTPLASGGTFTQADIDDGKLTYAHNGDAASSDSFTFTVADGAGGTIALTTFNININCVASTVVTTTANDGAGSLREALLTACPGNTVTFDATAFAPAGSPYTITLASELFLDRDLTLQGPTASRVILSGGGVTRVFSVAAGQTVTLSNLTIAGGQADLGGGIYNLGNLTITNSTLSANHATQDGGAIDSDDGTLTIINSTLSGNTAHGGGGALHHCGNSTALLVNVTVTNNRADADDLSPGAGGGLEQVSSNPVTLRNSIVAGNFVGTGATADDLSGGSFTLQHSLIETPGTAVVNDLGGNILNQSAQLAALAANGGPTETHLLLPGSPAINTGSNALAQDQSSNDLTTDQRGLNRIINTTVDMGAVEVNYSISATAGTPQSATINTAFSTALQATVTEAGTPQQGLAVTFAAPGSGASGTFAASATVTTDANGVATAPTFTANGTAGGPYNVTATLDATTLATTFALTNTKANQTITFGALANKTFGDADFTVSATASSGLSVSFAASGDCAVSGNTVSITGAGACTITAAQSGNADFNAAPAVPQSFNISKAATTTTVTVTNATFDGQPHGATATVTGAGGLNQSLTVTYTGRNATVYGPTTTAPTNAGDYTAAASFAENGNYIGSGDSQDFQIAKASQTITFGALPDKTFGDADFSLSATASSGLAVSFAASGNCAVSGNTVSITGAGACTITAAQAGNADFHAASDVARTFQIAPAATSTALASSANPSAIGQSVTFTATVTSAAGPPTGTVQFQVDGTDAGAAVALNASGTATFTTASLAAGTHAITAHYSGAADFNTSVGTLAGGQQVVAQPILQFNPHTYMVAESDPYLELIVTRTGDTAPAVTIDYATQDGTASQRSDYTLALGTLRFAAGETEQRLRVLINQDALAESAESFTVVLSNPTGGALLGSQSTATTEITDDANTNEGNALDEARAFVRQHYRDFLNREADPAGEEFWTQEILSCNQLADATERAGCLEVKRSNVSAAFFLSIEFQQTGFLVYRFYLTSFGESQARPHGFPRYLEFMRDTQAISRGVIAGVGDWQGQLAANQQAFAEEWVNRAEFLALYPESLTPEEYADELYRQARVTPTAAERQAAIDEFLNPVGGVGGARARVLRRVAAQAVMMRREFSRAFVLMQYFGYLRRNPNDLPDTDFGGYDFWLQKLNEHNDNFITSQMILSFILSTEYRQRFGQP